MESKKYNAALKPRFFIDFDFLKTRIQIDDKVKSIKMSQPIIEIKFSKL